nr:unnamed protein product [Digitaria exilis]
MELPCDALPLPPRLLLLQASCRLRLYRTRQKGDEDSE